eukprot:TRINITY_DN1913_c0_g2_i2.p1 TRINITY_DN1913_c0_g2~~TRINITY_DN1913_c0_g2_i2.p1  ORF type:complete len:117 (+),score=7.08 TRINITY_DN1913_c0_g2_i2:40-390(+)
MDPILSSLAPFLQLSGHTPREALIKAENLDLVHKSMTSAPESIGQLTNLKMLLIHNNELSSLPISIGKLERLTRLSVEQNRVSFGLNLNISISLFSSYFLQTFFSFHHCLLNPSES